MVIMNLILKYCPKNLIIGYDFFLGHHDINIILVIINFYGKT